jgi:acyl-CoA hydrolase
VIEKKEAKQIKFFVILEFSVFVFMKIDEDNKKIKKKMWEEEEEENQKQLVVGDAPIDIIDLYNLAVPFLKKRSKG